MAVREVTESYLGLEEPITQANSIEYLAHYDFKAKPEDLNGNGPININVDFIDEAILLQNSSFILKLKLSKQDGTNYINTDKISLTNNGLMYMFKSVQLQIDGVEVEKYNFPGVATTVYGLLKYFNGYSRTGLMHCWCLDDNDEADAATNAGFKNRQNLNLKTANVGVYTFIIPFSHVFGDCGKIIKGSKMSVSFERNTSYDNNAIFKTDDKVGGTGADKDNDKLTDGKITIQEFKFRVAVPKLSATANALLLNYLVSKPSIYLQFNTKHLEQTTVAQSVMFDWSTTYPYGSDRLNGAVVCFQTDRYNNQKKNMSVFDNLSVDDGSITLNGITYPGISLNNGTKYGEYVECFDRYLKFRELFTRGLSEIEAEEFNDYFSLYCFDLSHQKIRTHGDPYNLKISFKFKSAVPANTLCYCVFFSERTMSFTTYGNDKMKAVRI